MGRDVVQSTVAMSGRCAIDRWAGTCCSGPSIAPCIDVAIDCCGTASQRAWSVAPTVAIDGAGTARSMVQVMAQKTLQSMLQSVLQHCCNPQVRGYATWSTAT